MSGTPHRRDLFGGVTEDEDVLVAHGVPDFDVRAVERPDRERTVEGEFHVPGSGSFHPGGRDLFREVRSRNDKACDGHPVVGDEDDLQLPVHLLVRVDPLRDSVDEADHELRHAVGRRSLGAEDERAWREGGARVRLDPPV